MLKAFFYQGYWLFALPFAANLLYLIFLQSKWYHNSSQKFIRRLYYFASLSWITAILVVFGENIMQLKIFQKSNYEQEAINLIAAVLAFVVFTIFWDLVFISCQTISKINLKGVEITTQEFVEAAKAIETTMDDLQQMERIVHVQHRMFMKMYDFQNQLLNLDEKVIYKKLLSRYARLRKNIRIDSYENNEAGLHLLKRAYKINDTAFSGIRYALANEGICLPVNGGSSDKLFAVVDTAFNPDNMIIVISGSRIMKTEHLVIQNIISHFDNVIESEGRKALLEDMCAPDN